MQIEMSQFYKTNIGWNMSFEIKCTEDQFSKCDFKKLELIGDYDFTNKDHEIIVDCVFDKEELRENETIEERIELIKKDIEQIIVSSC